MDEPRKERESVMRPIIILSLPRSGSSMTAGIFAKHGVWVGPYMKGDRHNAKGHFEGLPFKEEIKKVAPQAAQQGIPADPVDDWPNRVRSILHRHGYSGGPWLFKGSAMYYPLWLSMDPCWICVRRDIRAIEQSGKRSGMMRDDVRVPGHVGAMDYVRDELGGVDVFTDELIAGDYSSIVRAFDHCGIKFDPAIADDFIDPTLWHF